MPSPFRQDVRHLGSAFFLIATLLAPAAPAAQGFSTEPPPIYGEQLAPLLVPAETALAAAADSAARAAAGEDGTVILAEDIVWVAADGTTFRVHHRIKRANTEAVVKELGREIADFRPSSQKVYLALARTLPPGGGWLPVRPDAAFVQAPQETAEDHLYRDAAELVVIFPQMRIGSVTELIVLTEEPVALIPGQLSAIVHLSGTWSSDLRRTVVELPAAMAARLTEIPVGGAPAAVRQDLPEGRVRFEWSLKAPAPQIYEPEMAPPETLGPAVWISTLRGWEEVADWFRGLLAGRDELPPELRAQAEEWTRDAKTPLEVVKALHRHVADDIRYTGLEFGIAGYQPKTPAEVWQNLYGDCKDKSNLLRALLAAKGIRSHLALVSTEHRGAIEKRSPGHQHFDHAILAIELPGEKDLLWADPTVSYLEPGQLAVGAASREALLITADGWRFATTSAPLPSHGKFTIELQVDAGGGFEGFLDLATEGLAGAAMHRFFEGDQQARLRAARRLATAFFAEAEVIDVGAAGGSGAVNGGAAGSGAAGGPSFASRIYFTIAGGEAGAGGEHYLPAVGRGFFDTGIDQPRPRRTDYLQRPETLDLEVRFGLPAGWAPREVPAPFEVEVPAFFASGAWRCEPGLCRLAQRLQTRQMVVPPAEFAAYNQAGRAFGAWTRRPLALAAGEPGREAPTLAPLDAFPLMPTGAGQLRLLEHKYPLGRQDELRRAALGKVLQWFPSDATTVFDATVELGRLDCQTGAAASGAEILRRALGRHAGTVSANDLAWGRFLLASCPEVKDEEALPLLRQTSEDKTLLPLRRGWALLLLAEKIEPDDPRGALQLNAEAITLIEAISEPSYAALAWAGKLRCLALLGDPSLEAQLAAALEAGSDEQMSAQLAEVVSQLDEGGQEAAASRVFAALDAAAAQRRNLAEPLAQLRTARDARAAGALHAEIARELARLFAESPPSWWSSFPVDAGDTAEEAAAKVDRLGEENEPAPFVRQLVHLLTSYPPRADFSDRLRQIAWAFSEPFLEAGKSENVLALLERLPKSDDNHWEGLALRGNLLIGQGRPEAAAEVFRRALADPDIPAIYASVFANREFVAELAAERFTEAARLFEKLEPGDDLGYPWFAESLARAILLALEEGREDEARRYLRRLAPLADEAVAESSYGDQILSLRRLAGEEAWARQAWASQQSWWPEWLALGAKLGYRPAGKPVTALVDLRELPAQVAGLSRQNQPGAAFAALEGLAHAARWDPAMAVSLAATLAPLIGSAGGAQIAAFQARLLSALPPGPTPELRAKQLLMLGAALIDDHRAGEALAPLRELLALGIGGSLTQRATGLLALAAAESGQGLEEARDLLAGALDDSYPEDGRALAVSALADLYGRLGQPEELTRLLEREVKNPVFAGTAELAKLESRLAASRQGGKGDLFDLAFAEFHQRHPLPILALAEPASLADPRVAGKAMDELFGDQQWLPAERVKLAFLIASDRRRPMAEKTEAIRRLQRHLTEIVPDQQKYREMMQALAEEKRFPPAVRSEAHFGIGANWADLQNLAQLEAFLLRPDLDLEQRVRKVLETQRDLLIAIGKGPEGLESWVAGLLSRLLDDAEAASFGTSWAHLILRGPPGAAERLLPRLESLQVTRGAELADRLRLRAERTLVTLAEARPILELLRQKIPGAAQPIPRPDGFDQMKPGGQLETLTSAQCRRHLVYDLHQPSLDYAPASAWMLQYLTCQERDDGSSRTALSFLNALLESPLRDATKAEWLTIVAALVGDDEPLWPELLAAAKARVDASTEPETRKRLRLFEIERQLRAGGKVDFAAEKKELQGLDRAFLLSLESGILLRDNDLAGAKVLLASLSPAELKDDVGQMDRLALARLLPESPESKWIEKAARREAYENRLEALATCSLDAAETAIQLAVLLDGGNTYGQEWFDLVLACQQNRVGRARLAMVDAEARQDWQLAYSSALALIAHKAVDHDDQFNLGRAAFHLGKKEEAKAALTLYLSASQGYREVPEAREMLARLAAP